MDNQRFRLLVVDHNKLHRESLVNRLQQQGYMVTMAEDGYIAIGMLDVQDFDLVFLERHLPKVDGAKILRQIKANRKWRHIPVIITSTTDDMECASRCIQMGAEDCLRKPFNSSFLLARVEASLGRKEMYDRQVALHEQLALQVQQLTKNTELEQPQQAEILYVLAKLVESRDADGIAHLERTREYCTILGQKLAASTKFRSELTPDYINNLRYAAPLHDIGQVRISDSTLLSEKQLSSVEWESVRMHPIIGADTLRTIQQTNDSDFIRMSIDLVESHHEKWDGAGYPAGKREHEIPLSARIFALADAYDALTSRRCYREAVPHEQASRQLVIERGHQFDPVVVDAFLATQQSFLAVQNRHMMSAQAQSA